MALVDLRDVPRRWQLLHTSGIQQQDAHVCYHLQYSKDLQFKMEETLFQELSQ
jgi:hypothetical protein